jgi:hypothetical protein
MNSWPKKAEGSVSQEGLKRHAMCTINSTIRRIHAVGIGEVFYSEVEGHRATCKEGLS